MRAMIVCWVMLAGCSVNIHQIEVAKKACESFQGLQTVHYASKGYYKATCRDGTDVSGMLGR